MSKLKVIKPFLANPLGRVALVPYRAMNALRASLAPFRQIIPWLFNSRELTNFTYDYSPLCLEAALNLVMFLTGQPKGNIRRYLEEFQANHVLKDFVRQHTLTSDYRYFADADLKPGRRLFYYLLVRATEPRVVVEAGVDKGLGACVIGAALRRNREGGHPGSYFGLTRGTVRDAFLFTSPYDSEGELVFGDSVDFLRTTTKEIDLFIHDTTNDPTHEKSQFEALAPCLSAKATVMTTWFTGEFARLSDLLGWCPLTFKEAPANHWYPGCNLGFLFNNK